ncbi:hypothetical protein EBU24_00750 [bacterium]|nr:hypothetical protein [bacterium]
MAATGLLGFNPYGKAPVIDIASKPANLYIQLRQKEEAKKEALDKYLMDYEKTLNPNGMRQIDQNAFLNKLGEAKQYYLQNREKILNPAKYGAEYQSTYYAGLRNAQSLIGQSKQAAAADKITAQHFTAQKDLNAPDGYVQALELSHLPIDDPRYRPLDITQWKFYKSHNPIEYANKIYSKIPLSESEPIPYDVKGKPGYFYTKTTSKVSPQYKDAILQEGYLNYINDEGLRKEMNHTFDTNKSEVKRLEDKYKTKIPNAQALAGIYTWDLQPIKETSTDIKPTEEYKSYLIASRSKNKPLTPAQTAVKFLQGGVAALKTSDANVINDYFKPFKSQTKTSTKGEAIGFENIEILPEGKVKVNYSIPINSGGVTIKRNTNRIIDTKSPSLLQELTALYQEFLGSNVGAEAGATAVNPNDAAGGKSSGKKVIKGF